MNDRLPLVAAIPNFNMAGPLGDLLPQLTSQNYDEIIVLDDASTDGGASQEVAAQHGVRFMAGTENIGSGGNRNRILKAVGYQATLHFIDADMTHVSARASEAAREMMGRGVGFAGGLVLQQNGMQHPFNYGPPMTLRNSFTSLLQEYVSGVAITDRARANLLRERYSSLLQDWPDPLSAPTAKRVFWAAESNLVMRLNVLEQHPFDRRLRNHEVNELAIRLNQAGFEQRFDPALAAVHTAAQVRTGNRSLQMMYAEAKIAAKHGVMRWLLSGRGIEDKS
jgi:glycosyltransferase involved in cell wall biosynthesis